ncbi:O66 family O-antigen flippase [Escherichia coli]
MNYLVNRKDIIWGYLSQFLNISSSLLLLPFILKCLNEEEIGLWYVFVAMAGIIQLLEFGLLPTISRFISYVYSGALNLEYGKIPKCNIGDFNKELLNDVVVTCRCIYFKIALFALVGILILGNAYIYTLSTSINKYYILCCWSVYGLSICIQLYFGYYNAILKGRGDQTLLNKIIVVAKLTLLLISIPLLIAGCGLVSLAVGAVISVIIDRILIRKYVYSQESGLIRNLEKSNKTVSLKKVIWQSARDMGVVQLGNYLSVRAGVLIVSSFVNLDAAASYGLTVQVTMVIVIIASMFFGLNIPRITSEQAHENMLVVKNLMKKSLLIANCIYIFAALILVAIGDDILAFLTKNTTLLPKELLILYLVTALFEMNYSICTSYLTTRNEVIFIKNMLYTGVAIVLFSFISTYIAEMGVLGVILSQLLMQSLYNNWHWPLKVYQELKND